MIFPLRLKERLALRAARRSPAAFRRAIRLSADEPAAFGSQIQAWQKNDFEALDAAWLKLAGRRSAAKFQRAYIERPRGHAKTSDMAVQIAWILLFSPRPLLGLAAAADRDQAVLLRDAVERIVRVNPQLCAGLKFQRHVILNPATGSKLDIISSDVESSWGQLPDFVVCDELCH